MGASITITKFSSEPKVQVQEAGHFEELGSNLN